MTDAPHLSEEDYAEIAKRYSARLLDTGKGSVEYNDWPDILGADLFKRAVTGGYFGPVGTIPGFPYGALKVKGVQVTGTSGIEGAPGIRYDLWVDGEIVATEYGGGGFGTVDFAKRHGFSI